MKTIVIEIRASEGGNDSKLLVKDLTNIYIKSCRNNNFSYKLEESDGISKIWITGNEVFKYFKNESGSHCFVRIPPTEKNDRVQTSFITVAIMKPEKDLEFVLDKNNLKYSYIRSSGNGGQNINKVNSCVQLTHIPTGLQVKVQDTRDQNKNKEIAYQRLFEKLKAVEDEKNYQKIKKHRNDQIGYGNRGTKKRTYRIRENIVIDHETGRTCQWKDFSRGNIQLLL